MTARTTLSEIRSEVLSEMLVDCESRHTWHGTGETCRDKAEKLLDKLYRATVENYIEMCDADLSQHVDYHV